MTEIDIYHYIVNVIANIQIYCAYLRIIHTSEWYRGIMDQQQLRIL